MSRKFDRKAELPAIKAPNQPPVLIGFKNEDIERALIFLKYAYELVKQDTVILLEDKDTKPKIESNYAINHLHELEVHILKINDPENLAILLAKIYSIMAHLFDLTFFLRATNKELISNELFHNFEIRCKKAIDSIFFKKGSALKHKYINSPDNEAIFIAIVTSKFVDSELTSEIDNALRKLINSCDEKLQPQLRSQVAIDLYEKIAKSVYFFLPALLDHIKLMLIQHNDLNLLEQLKEIAKKNWTDTEILNFINNLVESVAKDISAKKAPIVVQSSAPKQEEKPSSVACGASIFQPAKTPKTSPVKTDKTQPQEAKQTFFENRVSALRPNKSLNNQAITKARKALTVTTVKPEKTKIAKPKTAFQLSQ